MTNKALTIQVSDNGDDYTVDVIMENGDCEADSHFSGKDRRAKAEKRAEQLTKLLGCSWESNY
jgi:hypothetical protein